MFFSVKYKNPGKPSNHTIVQARDEEAAILIFNNPEEVGLTAEIKEIKPAKRIASGWTVNVENPNGFPIMAKTDKEIPLDDKNFVANLIVGGKKNLAVKVRDIVGASKPSRDKGVMNITSYIN